MEVGQGIGNRGRNVLEAHTSELDGLDHDRQHIGRSPTPFRAATNSPSWPETSAPTAAASSGGNEGDRTPGIHEDPERSLAVDPHVDEHRVTDDFRRD